METLATIDLAAWADIVKNILYAALGLGLVIFFHELGHFAVAKWCGVFVERFSIGFGPILWSHKRGETEYALSAIPFGGYVKMMGQDDLDPSQLSSEEIAEDPRSYSAKSVWQRMAIISAGVIMNVATGLLFFAFAYQLGVLEPPSILGSVQVGKPAWTAGLRSGDQITRINRREANTFLDIVRGVALTDGDVSISGVHTDGTTFDVSLTPDRSGTRRVIGAHPTYGLMLVPFEDKSISPTMRGSGAAEAEPPLKGGDKIEQVDGIAVKSSSELFDLFSQKKDQAVELTVARETGEGEQTQTEELTVNIVASRFRTLGLWMDIGQVAAIQDNSPAAGPDGLKLGDKIAKVDGRDVGREINPLTLPDYFAEHYGKEVLIEVVRIGEQGAAENVEIQLSPRDQRAWTEPLSMPRDKGLPLPVPSLGFAFHLTPTVLNVEPDSPAARAEIPVGARITNFELFLPEGTEPEPGWPKESIEFALSDEEKNWATAFWTMQQLPTRQVKLTAIAENGQDKVYSLIPEAKQDWYLPSRGLWLAQLREMRKAEDFGVAMTMGLTHTRNSIEDIYLTLRNLFGGLLSPKELHGPVSIAKVAYRFAEEGFAALLLFLGFLSINLAVLNFLPIPVLDGGHMVFLIWEAVTRKKPTEKVVVAATYCGMIFVLGLMLFVICLDLFVHKI